MKIVSLKSSNIKRIRAVELEFDENKNLVLITGKNAQGKSSILDSIWWALGGTKNIQDKPIREGADGAQIQLELKGKHVGKDNKEHELDFIVTRTFTEKSSYLKVENKSDGSSFSNAQEFLDFFFSNLSFDPLAFSRLLPKKQVDEIKKIVGLDFTETDRKIKELTEDRLLTGRDGKALPKYDENQIVEAKLGAEKSEVSIAELSQKFSIATSEHDKFIRTQDRIAYIDKTIAELQTERESLAAVKDTEINLDELKSAINNADEENKKIREAKAMVANINKRIELADKYNNLTAEIKKLNEDKNQKLAAAELPIDGLSWSDDGILYNNIPFEQISSAEKLRVSMAIAIATNPRARIILIKDGSLLDQDNLAVIEEMAKGKDFTIFCEKVDDSGKIGIYIEDGEVKRIN